MPYLLLGRGAPARLGPVRANISAVDATDEQNQRTAPLNKASVTPRLPCEDLERARAWYRDKLGLEPAEQRPGGLLYRLGATSFALFASAGKASGDHTQMAFDVADIESVVAELKRRGVAFDDVDVPGLKTVDSIADIVGNYPSKGTGERGAWFRDSEGNLLGVGESVRYSPGSLPGNAAYT